MQTFTPETPRRPRRSDRYEQPNGQMPQEQSMFDTAPRTPVRASEQAWNAPRAQAYARPDADKDGQAWYAAMTSAAPMPSMTTPPPAQRSDGMRRPQSEYAQRQPTRMLQSEKPSEEAVRREARESYRLPKWITAVMAVLALACAGLFAGEKLMQAYLVQHQEERVAAYERVVNAHPVQFRQLINRYAEEYNLQPAFVCAIILNESSFNTSAQSRVGARGLMQLMPDTAQWIAHKLNLDGSYDVDQLWEAETNIRFGCWYLNYLSKLFGGDAVAVASAYHAGQGEISAWLQNSTYAPQGRLDLDAMPDGPTKTYAGRVTRDYAIYDALYDQVFNRAAGGGAADGGGASGI